MTYIILVLWSIYTRKIPAPLIIQIINAQISNLLSVSYLLFYYWSCDAIKTYQTLHARYTFESLCMTAFEFEVTVIPFKYPSFELCNSFWDESTQGVIVNAKPEVLHFSDLKNSAWQIFDHHTLICLYSWHPWVTNKNFVELAEVKYVKSDKIKYRSASFLSFPITSRCLSV